MRIGVIHRARRIRKFFPFFFFCSQRMRSNWRGSKITTTKNTSVKAKVSVILLFFLYFFAIKNDDQFWNLISYEGLLKRSFAWSRNIFEWMFTSFFQILGCGLMRKMLSDRSFSSETITRLKNFICCLRKNSIKKKWKNSSVLYRRLPGGGESSIRIKTICYFHPRDNLQKNKCVCLYLYVYVCVSMYACVYVYRDDEGVRNYMP